MQELAPVSPERNPNSHTSAEVLDALRGKSGSRMLTFRYELLSSANVKLLDLDNVLSGSVEQNWLADIKRKAKFTIQDTGVINFLSDRIKPYARLHLPPWGAEDWVEWPQGVFLPASPTRHADETDTVIREVEGYDPLQVFLDDKTASRYIVYANTLYTTGISDALGSIPKSITVSTAVLPVTKEWEPGTSKLTIINDLLGAINYESLSFDEDGMAIVQPYAAPSARAEEYTYADDQDSVMLPNVDQELDLFNIPNKWVLTVSEPDRDPIRVAYINTDPASPTSTVRRGRTITDSRVGVEAADLAALTEMVERLAFEASQIYEAVEFETSIMPIHSGNDVYRITYSTLAVDAKYSEHTWSMPLVVGGVMKHRARRVVTI